MPTARTIRQRRIWLIVLSIAILLLTFLCISHCFCTKENEKMLRSKIGSLEYEVSKFHKAIDAKHNAIGILDTDIEKVVEFTTTRNDSIKMLDAEILVLRKRLAELQISENITAAEIEEISAAIAVIRKKIAEFTLNIDQLKEVIEDYKHRTKELKHREATRNRLKSELDTSICPGSDFMVKMSGLPVFCDHAGNASKKPTHIKMTVWRGLGVYGCAKNATVRFSAIPVPIPSSGKPTQKADRDVSVPPVPHTFAFGDFGPNNAVTVLVPIGGRGAKDAYQLFYTIDGGSQKRMDRVAAAKSKNNATD